MSESSQSFVHLHLHTQYSLLQGMIRIKPLMERLKLMGMPAAAITDNNNMFGATDFYFAAKEAGIQPILGCEIQYAPESRFSVQQALASAPKGSARFALEPKVHPLVLLCKDLTGYQSLSRLLTRAYTEAPPLEKGQAQGPRFFIDREMLETHGEGLVVLSAGLKSEIAYRILTGKEEDAEAAVLWFKKKFGGDFYLELQDTAIPEQDHVNEVLYGWSKKHGVPCVATTECHYLDPKDAEAHEILQCIERGLNLDFERPKSLVPAEFYLKSPDVMRARFERYPGACDNTLAVAEKCKVQFKFKDEKGRSIYHLPDFRPEGVKKEDAFDLIEFFRQQAREGLRARFSEPVFSEKKAAPSWSDLEASYLKRLEDELVMIERTGFVAYFLIVADFINWAKERDIPVGPGRGSGAGSLVAYALKITNIDPIEFNLLFERFINPERISMPDFDIDFCQDRRGEVIEYVTQKYGKENVSQIITFGKLQARAVIKDVGRVLGLSFAETDQLTKLLPDELNIRLDQALEKEPQLREKIQSDAKLGKVFEYALALEGLYRNAGIHAAGVIITEHPIVNYCPLFVGKDGDVVTQFDKDFSEKIGLVKYDFLGLKTLTVIANAVKLVRAGAEAGSSDEKFNIDAIHTKDPKVFELIGSGDTDGVFQVESSGMKDLCLRILPNSLEDLTAINALYRPGPLGSGMVDDFIDRKHGRKQIEYEVPELESILKDTYGVILYQEQVMQIARELAGYSLGQADLLRRAMGKKKPEEMAKHRQIFLEGAVKKGLKAEKAGSIFDLMAKFAEYGFNKSHSAAYGLLTYQTAYLKAYFPAEFMAALMTTEMSDTDKIAKYTANARLNGIQVLPPDVNASLAKFSVEKVKAQNGVETRAIRFGLEAIKGVGGIAVEALVESRREKGEFRSVSDFSKRVSTRKANKKVLESLTLAGAFDRIAEVNRASLFASLEKLLEHASDEQAERALGQSSLFDNFTAEEIKLTVPTGSLFKQEAEWPQARKLALEKQVVGFYVSGHPLDSWQKIFDDWLGWNTDKLKKYAEEKAASSQPQPEQKWGPGGRTPKKEIKMGGLLSEIKEITTKKGSRMAFGVLEDLHGRVEIVFFPEAFTVCQEMIKQSISQAEPIVVSGEMDLQNGEGKILARSIEWANEAHKDKVKQVYVKINPSQITVDQLRELKKSFIENRGVCPVTLAFDDPVFKTRLELPKTLRVAGTPQFVAAVSKIFGPGVVSLK